MANQWRSCLQISRGVKGGRWISRDGKRVNARALPARVVVAFYGLPEDGEDSDLGEYEMTIRRQAPMPAELPALTQRQADVLVMIEALTADSGYAPTVRELCDHLGMRSTCTGQTHIQALIRKGYLARRKPGGSRGLIVLHSAELDGKTMARIRREEAATQGMVDAGGAHGR